MKAAVFHAAHDIRVEDVPAPTGVGPREVLARPYWCGICGTDLHEYAMGPIVTPATPHPLNGAMVLAQHDIALVGTWCYPVTDFPRIAGLIASGRYPVEKVVSAKIAIEDIVEKGFEALLSPTGGQVKVLVNARG